MSAYPSLPLFTDAYIADTAHLTNEEHGAYLRLLMFAWRAPKCCLPDDDARIARMLGLTPKKWAGLKPNVMAFWTLENGSWMQSRLSRERQFVEEKVEKRRAAGKLGGRPKSLENNETEKANGSVWESKPKAPTPTLTPTEEYSDTNVSSHSPRERKNPWPSDYRDRVWAIYPKHAEKKDGMAALDALHRADKLSWDALRSGIERFNANLSDPQYAPALHRWLKKERWSDEYQASTRRPPPTDRPPARKSAQATFLDIAREAHEQLNPRSQDHERPFDGEILGPDSPEPTARHGHLKVYERPGGEAGELYPEAYPRRVRAFG